MTDRPHVVLTGAAPGDVPGEVLGGADDEPERPAAGRLRRVAALALAAAVGFGAAQLVAPAPSDGAAGASLALVTGRQPHLEGVSGEAPASGMEVTLVNTGSTALRLDSVAVEVAGAAAAGGGAAGPHWDVDRPLEPGRAATALLRDQRPCEGPPDALSGVGAQVHARVRSSDEATGDRLPDVLLPLPPTIGRLYDDHVRVLCGLPRLPEALEVLTGPAALDGQELVVPVGLVSRSVRALSVAGLVTTVPGLSARLIGADGAALPLPLALPDRTRTQVAEGVPYDDPASTPYRLRLSAADAAACASLRDRQGGEALLVAYADAGEPELVVERPVWLDLAPLLDRGCPAPTG